MGKGNPHYSYIGKQTKLDGKINFKGAVWIDGQVCGQLHSEGDIFLREGALIEADVQADTIESSGEIRGNIRAQKRVEIKMPGKVYGDIYAPTVVIHPGVVFEGACHTQNL